MKLVRLTPSHGMIRRSHKPTSTVTRLSRLRRVSGVCSHTDPRDFKVTVCARCEFPMAPRRFPAVPTSLPIPS